MICFQSAAIEEGAVSLLSWENRAWSYADRCGKSERNWLGLANLSRSRSVAIRRQIVSALTTNSVCAVLDADEPVLALDTDGACCLLLEELVVLPQPTAIGMVSASASAANGRDIGSSPLMKMTNPRCCLS
jgi:hypothetical protein